VGGIDELRGVTDAGDALLIGARTTHYQLIHDPLVAEHAGCWPRPPARWPTPRSGTAARWAARSRTPTRPATCPP
jgi:hypothetical protein